MLSTLIQILKAIHNQRRMIERKEKVVCYLLWYKFWKLFTTLAPIISCIEKLYVIYFDTNFESYSQRFSHAPRKSQCCMLSTLIQILKAIHNNNEYNSPRAQVVCYLLWYKFWKLFTTVSTGWPSWSELYVIYFDTNFESYSQRQVIHHLRLMVVCYLLWYKFWKLFTTFDSILYVEDLLYVIYFDTNFESYSQRQVIHHLRLMVVCYLLWYKFWKLFTTFDSILYVEDLLYVIYFDTNFESYSQQNQRNEVQETVVCYLLWYKFWKLFTTIWANKSITWCCMLSTLIQILKAIHNSMSKSTAQTKVVCYLLWYKFWKLFTTPKIYERLKRGLYVIYFDTNFESYSQLVFVWYQKELGCMLSTLIQILKAIHNACARGKTTTMLYVIYFDTNFESYSQLFGQINLLRGVVCYLLWYKFWKLFTTLPLCFPACAGLYVIYFDTNFESYSQRSGLYMNTLLCCMLSTLIQILKAIHNPLRAALQAKRVVCYLLWYKFWKLFTTTRSATVTTG